VPPPLWTEPFRVRSYEIGPDGRIALPPLCDWLQEAAGNHATALGVATDQLLEGGKAWVLTRLQVEVARYPAWREAVTVQTWPSAEDGLYAQRDFLLTDEAGGPIARATSQWLVIDVARRRPLRLPSAVTALTRPDRPHALSPSRHALSPPETPDAPHPFTVRRSDLDLNQHVNNVRYVEWALEATPPGVIEGSRCVGVDVQFRAESVYGDTIESLAEAEAPGAVRHLVRRASDHRLLAVLHTRWEQA
jgi:medium-chain acyl-[acyl-carrier-protein] hydrolase